jgi:hypothetical protein
MNRFIFMTIASALLIGCAGPPDVDIDGEVLAPPAQALSGPIGANGMNPVNFWAPATQSALRELGGGALVAGGALAATPLLDSAGGASVLRYVVRCALPEGAIVTSAGGAAFQGAFGLAAGWTDRALDTSEQRWVTACLLQHLNGLGAHVFIMLEGSHAALDPRPGASTSAFSVEDITTFGNVFVPAPSPAYACFDSLLQDGCGLDLSLHSLTRLCGLAPLCGVTVLGPCALHCTDDSAGDPACQALVGPSFPQSIRSSVRDTDLLPLYPGCDLL